MLQNPAQWLHLRERYEEVRPRKLLALDGGGIRGLITLGILKRMEQMLGGNDPKFRLCHFFDYIAGTSTGAIIAAGLALGKSVDELIAFYRDAGAQMFEPSHLLDRCKSLYKADPLRAKLQNVFGAETTLEPKHLQTLLLVVTRNVTTDSPWPISSNPAAYYNQPHRADCNLKVPLWQLVRASTAAPVYFPPEILNWDKSDPKKSFLFVDGGMTPYNNPAFLLFRMATQSAYCLNWPTGEDKLLLISVGTGAAASPTDKQNMSLLDARTVPSALMYGASVEQDVNCRIFGRCVHGDMIDREVRDLTCREGEPGGTPEDWLQRKHLPLHQNLGRAFLYARYNADLSRTGLEKLNLSDLEPAKVQKLDGTDQIDNLLAIGAKAGEAVQREHFGPFISI